MRRPYLVTNTVHGDLEILDLKRKKAKKKLVVHALICFILVRAEWQKL